MPDIYDLPYDEPENGAALVASRDAVDAARAIGMDRETFLRGIAAVWDRIMEMENSGERRS
jgi:hypothetical protein